MSVKKLTYTAILSAIATICSVVVYIPLGLVKAFPIQHTINVISAVLLGPQFAVMQALITSTLRILLGTGSIFAYPGSVIGALLAGIIYKKTKKIFPTVLAEMVGTGIIGALATYPIAIFLLGKEATLFGLMPVFLVSSCCGALIAYAFLGVIIRSNVIERVEQLK